MIWGSIGLSGCDVLQEVSPITKIPHHLVFYGVTNQ